jgi:hypothetical protein
MSIDETKTCATHTKEKERLGICCQEEDQKKAEQQTYEHSPLTMNIHELAKTNPTKTYKELEKIKSGVCIIGAMKHDRR